ncbi:helix-turn-helix domain-containing protein [Luteitalea sp.]|uniref:helix-turn-helix domain-containing protein n=1 Tax=Luteitalea sp. TaxID=2004800 RepID=UPI0037C6D00C
MPTLPHVLRASLPVLDAPACVRVGARLLGAREASGLVVTHVAQALLLSPRQVRALEQVEPEAFHNTTFYLKALRKYVGYLGLPADLLEGVVQAQVEPMAEPAEARAPGITMRVMSTLFGN